jgi:hypothetical protein
MILLKTIQNFIYRDRKKYIALLLLRRKITRKKSHPIYA